MSTAGGTSDGGPDFAALVAASREVLAFLTESQRSVWRFGDEEEWELDQDEGILRLTFADGVMVEAPAQVIGTYNTADGTWMWAWNNPSIDASLTVDAQQLREYGELHGIERLTSPKWPTEEQGAWSMAALAVRLCGSQGAYRGPAGTAMVFITFGQVTISKTR